VSCIFFGQLKNNLNDLLIDEWVRWSVVRFAQYIFVLRNRAPTHGEVILIGQSSFDCLQRTAFQLLSIWRSWQMPLVCFCGI